MDSLYYKGIRESFVRKKYINEFIIKESIFFFLFFVKCTFKRDIKYRIHK